MKKVNNLYELHFSTNFIYVQFFTIINKTSTLSQAETFSLLNIIVHKHSSNQWKQFNNRWVYKIQINIIIQKFLQFVFFKCYNPWNLIFINSIQANDDWLIIDNMDIEQT